MIAGTTTEQALVRELNSLGVKAVLVPVKNAAEGMALLTKRKVDALRRRPHRAGATSS